MELLAQQGADPRHLRDESAVVGDYPDTRGAQERSAILVVGSHRSGTSAIARTVNLLGAALPRNLMPARADNPTGFWESADLMQVHDRFLEAVGSNWADPLPLADGAFRTAAAAACHDEILAVLHRDFADTRLFVVKDPRMCRLLPLWRKVLATFGVCPYAVLPVRNPLETAMSLHLRNGIPREQALAQWLVEMAQGELGTRGWLRCYVDYSACLSDPRGQARRLARLLDCFSDAEVSAALPRIEGFWSDQLRHYRFTVPTEDEECLPGWVRRTYTWAVQAAGDGAIDSAPMETMVRDIGEAAGLYGPLVRGSAAGAVREEENRRLVEEGRRLNADNERLIVIADSAQQENAAHRRQVVALSQDLERVRRECRDLVVRLDRNDDELRAAQVDRARLSGALDEAHAHSASLQESLARLRGEQNMLVSALQRTADDRDELRLENARLSTTLDEVRARCGTLQETLAQSHGECSRLVSALQQTTDDLGATRAEHEALHALVAEQRQRAESSLLALACVLSEMKGEMAMPRRLGGLLRSAWHGRLRQRLREDADIRMIASSHVFDAAYYLRRYPDVAAARVDPIVHYVRCGAVEGRDPHPLFDSRFYWSAYPDVARAGANALAHYLRFGAREGRLTHPGQDSQSAPSGIARLLGGRLWEPQAPPSHIATTITAGAAASLPSGSFDWLDPSDREKLVALLVRHGLTDGGTPSSDRDVDVVSARVGQALARLPGGTPAVSIVIPVRNQLRHTLACLESLALWPPRVPCEILIGDDASDDGSARTLADLPRVRLIRSEHVEGFLDNCNRTAVHARGTHLVLLNNDTVVFPGALDALLDTFASYPDCGLVGGKLLYPDGRLQEAGGVVWADGSGWNFGRSDRPGRAEYCYVRDADYCSGAAVALPAGLWRQLGGFDPRYRPAYYEDTDLAFRVRAAGLRVLYQPDAQVIHCEGVSNGTSESAGEKRHQRANRPVFVQRWHAELAAYGLPDARPACFAERTRRGRVLVLDTTPPTADRDSGSRDTQILLKILRRQGWHVTFLPENLLDHAPYTAALRQAGIECPHYPQIDDFMGAAARYAAASDAVIVSRQPLACRVIGMLRKVAPDAKLIFNTVDLHFLREEREAALFGDDKAAVRAAETRSAELKAIEAADATLVVSAHEAELLGELTPRARVCVMPVRREMPARSSVDFEQRSGVLFIGGFRHPPNQDAVRWLLAEIWPRVRALGLCVPLYIVGADAPPFLQDDHGHDVHVLGHVPRLADAFASVRLSVAPVRYGAGLKGKVIDSLLHGVPTVATPMAVEGSGLEHGTHLLQYDTPEGFAAAIVRLHEDADLWRRLVDNGLDTCRKVFSDDHADQLLRCLWADLGFSWCLGGRNGS